MSSPMPPTTFGFSSRNDWMSRELRGRSCSCCASRPRLIAWLSSVMLFAASPETVIVSLTPPTSSVDVDQRGAGRADEDGRLLELLEARRHDFDLVRARLEIGRLVSALIVGLEGPRHAGGLVGDEHRRALHGRALRIDAPCRGSTRGTTAPRRTSRTPGGSAAARGQQAFWSLALLFSSSGELGT